jgi:perosamine synthetase
MLANKIIKKLDIMFESAIKPLPLHIPEFGELEKLYVNNCLDTGWVSSVGEYVNKFEDMLAEACGVKYAIAVVNGTAALELALRVAGVSREDEVIMPSLTFVATANAACHLGVTPHFVDVDGNSLTMCPNILRSHLHSIVDMSRGYAINNISGKKISAIMPMHTFGHAADMEKLIEVAAEFNIPIVEDAAEALGSMYKDQACGSFGLSSAVSFNGNKVITTGGGGAVLTNSIDVAKEARHLSTTAKVPHAWEFVHDAIGYNYRMPNINAALGVGQLQGLKEKIKAKRKLASKYRDVLADCEDIVFVNEPNWSKSNYWLNAIKLPGINLETRNILIDKLSNAGYLARPVWRPLHKLKIFAGMPRSSMANTSSLENSLINLPSSAGLAKVIK